METLRTVNFRQDLTRAGRCRGLDSQHLGELLSLRRRSEGGVMNQRTGTRVLAIAFFVCLGSAMHR